MRSIWQSLVWKEWHEHKWKLAALVFVLWATIAIVIFKSKTDGFLLAKVFLSFMIVPLAVFVGLGVAANERSRNTLPFLQALPTPMWPIAITKLLAGFLTLAASVVLTLPLFYGWVLSSTSGDVAGVRRESAVSGNIYLDVVLLGVALAASFYIWSAATGVNRKDEVSAGAMALAVIIGWYVILIFFAYLFLQGLEKYGGSIAELVFIAGLSTAPAGFVPASGPLWDGSKEFSDVLWYRYLTVVLVPATVSHIILICLYIQRFGRTTNREVRSPQVAVRQSGQSDWLSPPRRSALAAIAWKQFRESGPLVAAGLAGFVGIAVAIFCVNASWFLSRREQFIEMVSVVGACIGFAITLIVGIGICYYDVSPQQNTFWRSRAINPNTWYWTKFFTGLIILLATLSVPLLVVVLLLHPDPGKYLPPDLALALLMGQAALFAAAVAATCFVRHAVYGAILSIPLMYLGIVAVWTALKAGSSVGWISNGPDGMIDMSNSQQALGFLLMFVVSTVLGWLAVRYDWGWKGRY